MDKAEKQRKTINIKILFATMIVVLAVSVLGASSILLAAGNRLVGQYVNDVGSTALFYFQASVDRDLAAITQFCQSNLSNNSMTYAYNRRSNEKESLELRAQLRQSLTQLMQQQESIRLVVYQPKHKEGTLRQSDFTSLSDTDRVTRALAQYDMLENAWRWYDLHGTYYLCNSYELSDGYCTVCLDSSILADASDRQTNMQLICEQNGVFLSPDSGVIDVSTDSMSPLFLLRGDQQVLLSESSTQGNFRICCLVHTAESQMQPILRFLMYALAVLIALASIVLFAVARQITTCLRILDAACTQIGSGALDMRITQQTRLSEAMHIFGTFNTMAEQIERLKISLYEHQLAEERSKMTLLRTQIKSHFFINCLNIIYSLAAIGNDVLIKEFSLCLVDYFRYLGSGFQDTVQLGSELHHLKNYIRIFEIRYPGRVFCAWSVEPELEDAPILPMILQTFVENIFTHALLPGEQIHIQIRVERRQEAGLSCIWIQISDDGPGTSADRLAALNSGQPIEHNGHGNGIVNVRQRLEFYYHSAASLHFQTAQGGMQVTLEFPEME